MGQLFSTERFRSWADLSALEINHLQTIAEADVIIKIEIFNWSNILVLQKNVEKSTETFSINNILTGVYVIKAYLSTGEIVNEIFVKQ